MKKTSRLVSLSIVVLLALSTLFVGLASASGLQVTFTTNPTIVAPGTNGYLEVNLKSVGGTALSSIEITASSWDPTVVIPQGNWEVYVGSLDSSDSYSLIYEFRVPSTASPGLYQVIFDIDYAQGHIIRQTAVVQIEDATVLDVASVAPSSITIGQTTTLVFNITNNCGTNIDNILFSWADANDLILPIGEDNKIMISSIGAENHTDVSVTLIASSGISPGVYPLAITMEYYDRTGTKQTVTSTVGLEISGTTTFELVLQQSTSGSTTFAVVNTGANVASAVIVSIPQQPTYAVSGSSSSNLGNLDAGDYTLATFQLTSTTSNNTGQFPSFNRTGTGGGAPQDRNFSNRDGFMNQSFLGFGGNGVLVQISYTDVFGIRQTIQKQVTISSVSSGLPSGFTSRTGTQGSSGNSFGQSQSSGSNNSLLYIVIGVVGIIVIVVIIQLGRKKKLGRFSKLFKRRKE
ncbi:MAG: hypothetical protein NT038_07085 [Euryarchaeota archaeon]|nr:hypothetical protein [Euryarchaeota archaeon]